MANTKGTSVISNPSGGGAQKGLGEKFSPDLFTGTGNFSVPIAVHPGRNGFQPELTLGYSSGNGNGVFGMGWNLSIPGVSRKTSKGIPIYEDRSDIFILSGAEDLVPIDITSSVVDGIRCEKTQYRPRTEGLFALIYRHRKSNGEHYWEVKSKDGLISFYGSPGYTSEDPAVIANPEKRDSISAWHLTKTQDTFGNVIEYEYERDLIVNPSGRSYDQIYLNKIKYCQFPDGDDTRYLCEVQFHYEDRPDPFSAYKQGFETRMTKRCVKVETWTNPYPDPSIKAKTYHFTYQNELPLNGVSLLQSISVEGHNDEESEFMPPLEFSYSSFTPTKRKLEEIKGPLPVMFLSEPGFELVDLTGNGLPDLLQLNGSARYWTNKGDGEFSLPRNLNLAPSVRLGEKGARLIDANGDGRSDLMVNDGSMAGYFPGAFRQVWDNGNFRKYPNIPSFSFDDPEVQLIDLDGDGVTDVLRNGAKFECFYNHPEKGFHRVSTALKNFADFSFSDPRIRFADMTGDGLQDIVLISSGRVQYWPNLGYGRFGPKVNMRNAPRFPEQYDPSQVLLGDLDGDGQADIAFVENNTTSLYMNQSGNSFSEEIKILNTPVVRDPKAVRITDIKGTGQPGILWTFGGGSSIPGRMFFLDFTNGNKPYVMEELNNNMGSITRVKYGSSVFHYLRDEKEQKNRWKTDLPFPVQVVDKVEVLDLLSGGKLVTQYHYHNGYWDGVEREFRGFAHVDSIDTESFKSFNVQDLFADKNEDVGKVDEKHYSPPTLTKSWFYVGPVGDGFHRWHEPDFSEEYWSGDLPVLQRTSELITLLQNLPRRARRDALRTLRGSLIRLELYALDQSPLEDRPYTVTESLMSLRKEFDPMDYSDTRWSERNAYWSGGGYVFFPFNIAQRTSQYERGNDPLHSFSFTKDYDDYGQAIGQLSVGLPRGASVPPMPQYTGPYKGAPDKYLATYSITNYIDDPSSPSYIKNRVKRTLSFDATRSWSSGSVFELRDWAFDPFGNNLPVLGCTLNYYDGDEFDGLPFGKIGEYGALVKSEILIITDDIISSAYPGATPECFNDPPDWAADHPAQFCLSFQNNDDKLGYFYMTGDPELDYVDGWYTHGPRIKYDFHDGVPAYGHVIESMDMFEALTEITYDDFDFLPISTKQNLVMGFLETEAEYDYRVLQPNKIIDPNNNISVFNFSPLGLLRATALIGKGGVASAPLEGDHITTSPGGFYDMYEPSVKMEYDFFAFKNSADPIWVKTISREQHYQDSASSDTITKVEYSDGFGRLLQTRVQAEDLILGHPRIGSSGLSADQEAANADAVGTIRGGSDPLNVVVSGWKIYNNKGKVVEQFEPYFDSGFDYTPPFDLDALLTGGGHLQRTRIFYDSLGRNIRTINPDKSEQRVVFGIPVDLDAVSESKDLKSYEVGVEFEPSAWESYTYDANDLADVTDSGGSVPATHHYTPKSSLLDALGRTISTCEHNAHDTGSGYVNVVMQYAYDVRGNLLLVRDPYNRVVFEHKYDLRAPQKGEDGKTKPLPPIYTKHIDKGESTILFDAAGKPIESFDAKGAWVLTCYDILSRPENTWAGNKTGDTLTLRGYTVYGESAGSPEASNLNGKPYEVFDEAGKLEFPLYDFKGNILTKTRHVVDDSVLQSALSTYDNFIMDWDSPPTLSAMVFTTDMEYDALNRIVELTLPEDLDTERKKIIPSFNRAGALEKVDLYSPNGGSPLTTNYVENIAYNAKGQRLLIAFGNNRMTRYTYDQKSFRLLRQRTEGYAKSTSGTTVTYAYSAGTNKQDDGFSYDLVGNILNIFTRVTDCGIGGTPDELDRTFEYDPLYRLTYADGRESDARDWSLNPYDDPSSSPAAPGDVNYYERSYVYDKLGNIGRVVQSGTNGFTKNYTYNSGLNTLQKIEDATPVTVESYSYDDCGNTLTTNLNRSYVWNHSDQLLCYYNDAGGGPTVFAQYDYAGQNRVSKIVRTGSDYERTIYIDGIFEYVKLENGSTYEKNYIHIIDDKSRIAEVRINPGTAFPLDIADDIVYTLEDQIGTSVIRLSDTGIIIDSEEYYPFGDSSVRTFTYKRYRYVGKERDAENGLYYYGARYYVPWLCRFMSVDPKAAQFPNQSSYNYCFNNPVKLIDRDGMAPSDPGEGDDKNKGGNAKSDNITPKTNGDGRPGIDSKPDRENRDKASGRWNESKDKTDIQHDERNYWQTQQDGDQTIVHWWSKDNSQIGGYYSFPTPTTATAGTEIEVSGSETIMPSEKPAGDDPSNATHNTISKKEVKPDKFNGVEIVKGATVTNNGVWAVLTTGPGNPEAGKIKDPLNDISKIMTGVKKAGNIKEIEITLVGWEGTDWTADQKQQYEYDLAAAKTNLQQVFQKQAGKNISIKFNANKIEQGGDLSTRTIIRFR